MSAATLSDDTPLEPDDELLVAYLDGELDRKDQSELENRLLDDPSLRKRLQQLQTGWELLDDLPDPAPSLKLVESTLELVVADIVRNEPASASWWSRFRLPVLVGLICLGGILAAFGVASMMRSHDYQRQLLDLAIVEHLDAYNYGSDLTLMRQLSADPNWSKMVSASREMGDIQIESIADVSATPLERREAMVKGLPLEKLEQLDARWERFTRLDEANRQRIRRTAEAVSQQPDAELLLQTMQAYEIWRQELPAELRDKIQSSDPKERREAIDQAIEQTQLSISRRSSLKLDDETIEWIYFALRQVLRQRQDAGDQATLNQMERTKSSPDAEFFTIASIVFSGGTRGPGGRRPPTGFLRGGGDRPGSLQPGEIGMIRLVLPERAIDILDLVAAGDPLIETMTLRTWAEEAIRRKFPNRRDDLTLLDRYNELPANERDALDLLPPKQILNELSRDFSRFPE